MGKRGRAGVLRPKSCLPASLRDTNVLQPETRLMTPEKYARRVAIRVGKSGRNLALTSACWTPIGRRKKCTTQSYTASSEQASQPTEWTCASRRGRYNRDNCCTVPASDSPFAATSDQATGEPLIVGVLFGLDRYRVNYRSATLSSRSGAIDYCQMEENPWRTILCLCDA
jgi:hypothetical protein